MLLNTELKLINTIGSLFSICCLWSTLSYAQEIDCKVKNTSIQKNICAETFKAQRQKLENQNLTAFLITDAPIRLLQDTHHLWYNRLQACKSKTCYQQQFESRADDLNFYTSMNQTLTQHYLKFEHGAIAQPPVHLQIHQLTKDRIKVEGLAYRNPNNRNETQTIFFMAYTTPDKKNQILDNNHDCHYQFEYSKAILKVNTQQKGCERFAGVYRLYD